MCVHHIPQGCPSLTFITGVLPPIESDYSVLGPEGNDTGPAATVIPPQIPVKQNNNSSTVSYAFV